MSDLQQNLAAHLLLDDRQGGVSMLLEKSNCDRNASRGHHKAEVYFFFCAARLQI
jgi:hypothetical protein